jgi:hypothetical protein
MLVNIWRRRHTHTHTTKDKEWVDDNDEDEDDVPGAIWVDKVGEYQSEVVLFVDS